MKIFSKHRIILLITATCLFLYGCIKEDDFDFNNMAANQWNPEFAVPLIHSSLSIKDITNMDEEGMFTVNGNHQIALVYNTNIYTKYGYEFFQPANQSTGLTLQLMNADSVTLYQTGTVSRTINPTMPLSFPNGEQIDSLTFRKGTLRINLSSQIPHDAVLNVKIPTASLNGQVFSKDVAIAAYSGSVSNAQAIFDMSGYNMGTHKNGMPNQLDLVYTLRFTNSNTTANTLGLNFDITTSFDSITPANMFGYFGQTEFILPGDTAEIGIFSNFEGGSVYFDDPKMTITLANSFGMPIDAQIGTLAAIKSNGTATQLTGTFPSPLIDYPLNFGQTATNSFYFDKSNSNLQTLINSAPAYFVYDLTAGTNSPLPTYNFMSDSSVFKADLRIDLPLKGYASGFTIQDTIDFSLSDIDELTSASFRINVLNGFPMGATMQLYFVNENFMILDSLLGHSQNRLIEAAEVDNNGQVIAPTKRATDETFEGARMQHLFDARKILIKAIIQTTDAPSSMVEVYDNYILDFKIGVRTKIKMDF